jgi:hypothetical protein
MGVMENILILLWQRIIYPLLQTLVKGNFPGGHLFAQLNVMHLMFIDKPYIYSKTHKI